MAENEQKNKKGTASEKKVSNKNVSTKASTNKKNTEEKKTSTKTSRSKAMTKASTKTSKSHTAKKTTASKSSVKKKEPKRDLAGTIKEDVAKINTEKDKLKEKREEKKEIDKKKEKSENIKQARRQLYYDNNSSSNELFKLVKIILIVTCIILVFYVITVIVTKKANEVAKEKNSTKAEIQYDSIMIGAMLNIDGTYYVLIEDKDDIRLSEYSTLIQTIKANDDAPTIYTANLSSSFNKAYLSNESNYDSDMTKFKVKGTTLVKVSNHKIQNVYDNYKSIVDKLDELDDLD